MAKQTFTTGQVLTSAAMTSLQQTAMLGGSASAKTANYTLVAADAGTAITMSNAGATTITVNTGLFAAGDTVTILNVGAGTCTITAGTATVSKPTNATLALVQNAGGVLYFTATGTAIFLPFNVGSDSYTEIQTSTLSGSQIDFNSISSSYKRLILVLTDFYLSSTTTLRLRLNNNSTASTYYQAGESNATAVNDNSNMFWINYATGLATTSKKNMSVFQIENYSNSTSYKVCTWNTFYDSAAGGIVTEGMTGGFKDTTAITSINILPTTGTMSGGSATLWGVK